MSTFDFEPGYPSFSSYRELQLGIADAHPATDEEIESTRLYLEEKVASIPQGQCPGSSLEAELAANVLRSPEALATYASLHANDSRIAHLLAADGYIPPTSDPIDF